MSNVLILENSYNDLIKSRFPLGTYLKESGCNVYYGCPNPMVKEVFNIPMSRNRLSPIQLLKGYSILNKLEANLATDTVLSFRLIPNVLNYLASYRNKKVRRIAVVTGLGYAFISTNNSFGSGVQRLLIKMFYRQASKRILIVAQNPDDLADLGIINGRIILGSGVCQKKSNDVTKFHTHSINLLYAGRLLKAKGILTAIEIFEYLKSHNPETTFKIAGSLDPSNPDSLNEVELDQLKSIEGINYLGFVNDMDSVYAECNVLLFPSLYREGVPRVIIESLKYGLTIITKDMAGCRETVRENGFLMNDECLDSKLMEYLSSLSPNKLSMNHKKSLELFKGVFSSEVIYPQYLNLLSNNSFTTDGKV